MIIEDEALYFDKTRERYYLKNSYVTNKLTNLRTNTLDDEFCMNASNDAEEVIKRSCNMLWSAIEKHAFHITSTLYKVTHSKKAFEVLKDALMLQLEYLLQDGDTANAVGFSERDRIHQGAWNDLIGNRILNVYYVNIPKRSDW